MAEEADPNKTAERPPETFTIEEFEERFPSATLRSQHDKFRRLIGNDEQVLKDLNVPKHMRTSPPRQGTDQSSEKGGYASFGDKGTTASIGPFGNLMQLTSYLGRGKSGFFSVDLPWVSEPWSVLTRAKDLAEMSSELYAGMGFGLGTQNNLPEAVMEAYLDPWKLDYTYDRWPRLELGPLDGFSMINQCYVDNGIIFDNVRMETTAERMKFLSKSANVEFSPDLRIRELEFTNYRYKFNEEDFNGNYDHFLGPHGRSLIIVHQGQFSGEDQITGRVGIVIALSINGRICELERSFTDEYSGDGPEGIQYRIKFENDDDGFWMGPSEPLFSTTAYRLQFIPDDIDWERLLITQDDFSSLDRLFELTDYRKLQFSPDPDLDFIVRRNVEHILSVCSVPAKKKSESLRGAPALEEDTSVSESGSIRKKPDNVTQSEDSSDQTADHQVTENGIIESQKVHEDYNYAGIAFTTGDVSGHRLVTSASFFAFEFLLSVYQYLDNAIKAEDLGQIFPTYDENRAESLAFAQNLRDRISLTAKGHVKWIVQAADTVDGCFATDYWASGMRVVPEDEGYQNEILVSPPLVDTSFQILKLLDYAEKFKHEKDMNDFKELVRPFVQSWVEKLDRMNGRGFYAFPRSLNESLAGNKAFRLREHTWIWNTLKAIEDSGMGNELRIRKGLGLKDKKRDDAPKRKVSAYKINYDYSSSEFQRHVLERFTTENNISRQRMLAVARSISYNRFMFHCKDTALFYRRNEDLFRRARSLWSATIDSQKYHKENQDSRWNDPLHYALAMVMASKSHRINTRPEGSMLKEAKRVLTQISSRNGIIPGKIDSETDEAISFDTRDMRDHYWHVSFEVPYAIWEHADELRSEKPSNSSRGPQDSALNQQPLSPVYESPQSIQLPELTSLLVAEAVQRSSTSQEEVQQRNATVEDIQRRQAVLEMKKAIPFNPHFIDQKSITDVSEEWLYDEPEFLNYDPHMKQYTESTSETNESDEGDSEWLGINGLNALSTAFSKDDVVAYLRSEGFRSSAIRAAVLDVRSTRSADLKYDGWIYRSVFSNQDLYQRLQEKRTVRDAKKRLIWAPNADIGTGLTCYLASPNNEKSYIASFFDRHFHTREFFMDEVSPKANIWRTEFHLSSYKLLAQKDGNNDTDLRFLGGPKFIRRRGIGFRFDGDFFDRFWTCHILDTEPMTTEQREAKFCDSNDVVIESEFKDIIEPKEPLPVLEPHKKPWHQRKILELIIFDMMLRQIRHSYKELFEEIGKTLQRHFNAKSPGTDLSDIVILTGAVFSKPLKSDTYLRLSKEWPPFLYTLQVMEEDIKDTLAQIGRWNDRERERQFIRPRWTNNDESRYRTAITKLTVLNNQKIRNLEHYKAQIQSLRVSLESRLESTRNELSFESAENVRFFTTVTVIFLPLGFATGVFSMSEAPEGKTIWQMVSMALITLALTGSALSAPKLVKLLNTKRRDPTNGYKNNGMIPNFISQGQEWFKKHKPSRERERGMSLPDPEKGTDVVENGSVR